MCFKLCTNVVWNSEITEHRDGIKIWGGGVSMTGKLKTTVGGEQVRVLCRSYEEPLQGRHNGAGASLEKMC
jgi:hypothetical protein